MARNGKRQLVNTWNEVNIVSQPANSRQSVCKIMETYLTAVKDCPPVFLLSVEVMSSDKVMLPTTKLALR